MSTSYIKSGCNCSDDIICLTVLFSYAGVGSTSSLEGVQYKCL